MLKTKITISKLKSEDAAALVELALVVPVIIFLGFCALEFTNILRYNSMAQLATREGASRAYRECSALKFPYSDPVACMNEQANLVYEITKQLSADSVVELYIADRPDPNRAGTPIDVTVRAGIIPVGFTEAQRPVDDDGSTYPSLSTSVLSGFSAGTGALGQHPAVATAEVWIRYKPLLPGIVRLFGMEGDWIYDATVI